MKDFDAPFLILHGKDDKVTSPELSQIMYHESISMDKEIILYDGMWHSITCAEPDEDIDRVFRDASEWMLKRL